MIFQHNGCEWVAGPGSIIPADYPNGPYYCPECGEVLKKEFEDLSMADTPKETYYKIEKLYNAMREKIND